VDEMDGTHSTHAGEDECIQSFREKVRRKETAKKTRRSRKDNNKTDFREIKMASMDWINVVQVKDR
jgi:hypothetical protein